MLFLNNFSNLVNDFLRQFLTIAFMFFVLFFGFVGCWDDLDLIVSNDSGDTDTTQSLAISEIVLSENCTNVTSVVTFSANTTGVVDSWLWDFGDGVTDTTKSPTHFFVESGYYDISLTITGPMGKDTMVQQSLLRVINPGWTKLLPRHDIGDIRDIWQSSSSNEDAFIVGRDGFVKWKGSTLKSIDASGITEFNWVSGYEAWPGSVALIGGKNANRFSQILFYESGNVENADPLNLLPHGKEDRYVNAHMTSSYTALLAVSNNESQRAEIWELDWNKNPSWSLAPLDASSVRPSVQFADFGYVGNEHNGVLHLITGKRLYATNWSKGGELLWDIITVPDITGSLRVIAYKDSLNFWLGTDAGELVRVTWNQNTSRYNFVVYTGDNSMWSSDYKVVDLDAGKDKNSFYALLVDENKNSKSTKIIKITNLWTKDPVFEEMDLSAGELETGRDNHEIAVFDDNQIWYGTENGYLAKWQGAEWQNVTGEITAGNLGQMSSIGADQTVYLPTNEGSSNKFLSFKGDHLEMDVLPEGRGGVISWVVAPDDIWVLGESEDAYHYNGSSWTTQDLGVVFDGAVFDIWGSSASDIWAVGFADDNALVLHYNGTAWVRDSAAEKLFGLPSVAIQGSASDNIYASGFSGAVFHYDGISWSIVEQTLFAWPDNFGQCVSVNPGSDCTGSGIGFGFQISVTPEGDFFGAMKNGEYEVITGEDASCSAGEYRCVLITEDEAFLSDQPVHYNGDNWDALSLLELIDGEETHLLGIWAANSNRVYATVIASKSENDHLFSVITWDGESWTALPQQPDNKDMPFFMEGVGAGDFYGKGFPDGANYLLMHYQTCEH